MVSDSGGENGVACVADFSEHCERDLGRAHGGHVHASNPDGASAKAHGMVVVHVPGFLREQNRSTSQLLYFHADLQAIIEFRWRMVIDRRVFYYKHAPGFTR